MAILAPDGVELPRAMYSAGGLLPTADLIQILFKKSPCHMHNYAYNEFMRYAYDSKKRASNLQKHGYDFEDASQVIESGSTVTFEDRRFSYDEQRFITLGMLRGEVVVIATAETDEEIRLICKRGIYRTFHC